MKVSLKNYKCGSYFKFELITKLNALNSLLYRYIS